MIARLREGGRGQLNDMNFKRNYESFILNFLRQETLYVLKDHALFLRDIEHKYALEREECAAGTLMARLIDTHIGLKHTIMGIGTSYI